MRPSRRDNGQRARTVLIEPECDRRNMLPDRLNTPLHGFPRQRNSYCWICANSKTRRSSDKLLTSTEPKSPRCVMNV